MRLLLLVQPLLVLLGCAVCLVASEPQIVLERFTEVDRLRQDLHSRQQSWASEQERAAVLQAALATERERLLRQLAEDRQAIAELEQRMAPADAELAAAEAAWAELGQRLTKRASAMVDGLLFPPGISAELSDEDLPATIAHIRSLVDALAGTDRGLLAVGSGAETRVVDQLRIGPLLWWRERDGSQAGVVIFNETGVELRVINEPEGRAAINRAFAIAAGRLPPEILWLPRR